MKRLCNICFINYTEKRCPYCKKAVCADCELDDSCLACYVDKNERKIYTDYSADAGIM